MSTTGAAERVDRRHDVNSKYNCTQYVVSKIRERVDDLKDLPHPTEEWMFRDTELPESIHMRDLQREGIIQKVGEQLVGTNYTYVYKTNEEAYDALQTILEEETQNDNGLLPCCANSWINNQQGVDGITCGSCGEIHDRSDL